MGLKIAHINAERSAAAAAELQKVMLEGDL